MQQNLLERDARAPISVYAIWMPIFPDDTPAKWSADLMADPRVTHWWDQDKRVGRWYAERMREADRRLAPGSVEVGGTILWDAYLVYPPGTPWDDAQKNVRRWGRPILATRQTLAEAVGAADNTK